MEDIYTWNVRNVYNYTISSIGKFNKKEDFEIFYYFKDFDFLHEGYNNVFLEILVWLSDHEEKIENLINETNNNLIQNDKKIWLNSSFIMAGTKREGKSIVLSQLLLQKDTVILEKKEFSLEQFKDEDKNYFYLLLINLTKEKNLNNFALQIQKNKKI